MISFERNEQNPKETNAKARPEAPWGNSTFEAEAKDFTPSSEYSTTYYVKPGDCRAEPIRPLTKGWRAGSESEKIESNTTYGSVFQYTPDSIDKEQAFRYYEYNHEKN